jgi:hypothetical protein
MRSPNATMRPTNAAPFRQITSSDCPVMDGRAIGHVLYESAQITAGRRAIIQRVNVAGRPVMAQRDRPDLNLYAAPPSG